MTKIDRAAKPQPPTAPAQPVYVLRGHTAQVHTAEFIRANTQLITGDADGWLVVWDIAIRRPVGVWKAHDGAILGASAWGDDMIISHGRDHRLRVWQMSGPTVDMLSKVLPLDDVNLHRPQPWLLHALAVNTLNFCPFSRCDEAAKQPNSAFKEERPDVQLEDLVLSEKFGPAPTLIAVPGSLDSGSIDIFQLPSEQRLHVIPVDTSLKTGMVMTLSLFYQGNRLAVFAGYESGHALMFLQSAPSSKWARVYAQQPHSQPVLSLTVAPDLSYALTSSADAAIAKHPIPNETSPDGYSAEPLRITQTKHAGQQGLSIRTDGKIFATAGWDSRVRVYAAKSMKELAVLKWHKDGCYATAFARIDLDVPLPGNDRSENGGQMAKADSPQKMTRQTEQSRVDRAKSTHWLAAGSKDGKVSLWEIY
ncbi:MAG: hypothetical protein M4579_004830 [Chaenotheca gracillima]|nr:MAG: hypothetical protein M4579_004830 [Chaenotheca gracillima]